MRNIYIMDVKKRGRPKKKHISLDCSPPKKEENIILFLELSDDDDKVSSEKIEKKYINSDKKIKKSEDQLSATKLLGSDYLLRSDDMLSSDNLLYSDNASDAIISENSYKKAINVVSSNRKKNIHLLEDKTNVEVCEWCLEKITTIPIGLPDIYANNTYYIFGTFCSFNCAASYNSKIGDYKYNTRHALLYNMKKKILNSEAPIYFSPHPEILKSSNLVLEKINDNLSGINIVRINYIDGCENA